MSLFNLCLIISLLTLGAGYIALRRKRRQLQPYTSTSLNFSIESRTKRIPLDAHNLVDSDDIADAFLFLEEIHQANCEEEPTAGISSFTRDDVARLVFARDFLFHSCCSGQDEQATGC